MTKSLVWRRNAPRLVTVESFLLTAGSLAATIVLIVILFFVVFLSRAS
jgi:hypothetical protein